jgi:hypothetical protein
MSYILQDVHYQKCKYFDRDISNDNYNVFDDPVLCHLFDKDLVINILESYETNNYDFIKNNDLQKIQEIYEFLVTIEAEIIKITTSKIYNRNDWIDNYMDFSINMYPKYSGMDFQKKNILPIDSFISIQEIKQNNDVLFTNKNLTKTLLSKNTFEIIDNPKFFTKQIYNNIDDYDKISKYCRFLVLKNTDELDKLSNKLKYLYYLKIETNDIPIKDIISYFPNVERIFLYSPNKNGKKKSVVRINKNSFEECNNLTHLYIHVHYCIYENFCLPQSLKYLHFNYSIFHDTNLKEKILNIQNKPLINLEHLNICRHTNINLQQLKIGDKLQRFDDGIYESHYSTNCIEHNDYDNNMYRKNIMEKNMKNKIMTEQHIYFSYSNNFILEKKHILPNIKEFKLTLSQNVFLDNIDKKIFPNSLETLKITGSLSSNNVINKNMFPDNLISLDLTIRGRHIKINDDTLTELTQLKELTIQSKYLKSLILPNTLTHLAIEGYRKYKIKNLNKIFTMCPNLEYLSLSCDVVSFKNLKKAKKLKYLELHNYIGSLDENTFPNTIEYLIFNYSSCHLSENTFKNMEKLKYIVMPHLTNELPKTIFKYNIQLETFINDDNIINNIDTEIFKYNSNLKIIRSNNIIVNKLKYGSLPTSLNELTLYYGGKLDKKIVPHTLKFLNISSKYKKIKFPNNINIDYF